MVELDDGSQLLETVGSMRREPAREDVIRKAHELIGEVIGAGAATELIDRVMTIEDVHDVRMLRPALLGRPQ
jgi:hypothetical protein